MINNNMPLAVPLMILCGMDDLCVGNESVNLLTTPLWRVNYRERKSDGLDVPDAEKAAKKHISEEIYKNSTDRGSLRFCDDDAAECYSDIFERKDEFNFKELSRYFNYFYSCTTKESPKSWEDVRECYKIMFEYRIKNKGTEYDKEFCWKIASMFLENHDTETAESDLHTESFKTVRTMTLEDSYVQRREMIRNASGTVYICGTTLKDAFSASSDCSIINDLFGNDEINTINIFLLNYYYIDVNKEDASKEIVTSILNIFDYIKENGLSENLKINIVLFSKFDIPFSLITSKALLKRSMYLFSRSREYKGQYLLFDNEAEEYQAAKKYYDFMLESAYYVGLNAPQQCAYEVERCLRSDYSLRQHVSLKRVHPMQIKNIVCSSFYYSRGKSEVDYSEYLNLDDTQRVLLPYLEKTEELLERVVKKHDKSGWAKIIPSADLGFPNNVSRIAGGFLTGALYDWSCSVPIIPVDATVNTCTSSVFRLYDFNENLSNNDFENIVDRLCRRAMNIGYSFTYRSGNHFLTVAKDDDEQYYLIQHSSAKQCKESCFGLYPSRRAWFNQYIKVEKDSESGRYLRYIRGNAAVNFYDYACRFRSYNEEIHEYVAEQFAELCGTHTDKNTACIKHHYGMPTSSSIAIGTFVVNIDEADKEDERIVPIFSDYRKDIVLFKSDSEQNTTYRLAGDNSNVILVPHGWGQEIDGIRELSVENGRNLILSCADRKMEYHITSSERIRCSQKHVRHFDNVEQFLNDRCKYLNGRIIKVLHPIYCYCERSFEDSEHPVFRIEE